MTRGPASFDAAKQESSKKSTPKDDPPPAAPDEATKSVAPKSPWTTILAQMKIPDGSASGTILGQEFVLEDAKLDNGILTLRQGKEFHADAEIQVFLFLKEGENVEGKKFRIEAREGFGVPHVVATARPKGGVLAGGKTEQFLNKYAMILQFGKTARGRLPGKIYVCLPDQAKSVVAGHFSVEVFDSTHPLATETLISGKFKVRGTAKGLDISLSCLGKNQEGKLESPGGGFKIGGGTNSVTGTTWAPRFSTVSWDEKTGIGSHKHVNRPPGHYLVHIRKQAGTTPDGQILYDGYSDWKWVELKDSKSKVTVDLVIDSNNVGSVEVSLTGPTSEKSVVYVPLDDAGKLPLPEAAWYVQTTSNAKLEGGKAVISGLREGKYQIALGPWQPETFAAAVATTVEVRRGATARVELKPPAPTAAAKSAPATKVELGMLPDLQVSQVYLKEGFMRAMVKNTGKAGATKFSVSFSVDGKPQSTTLGLNLGPGKEHEVGSQRLPDGTHVVKVVVDPDNQIRESDETNNSKEATLSAPR